MSTPHDEGRPEDAPRPGEEPRPAPRYGQYAPAGWQAPGSGPQQPGTPPPGPAQPAPPQPGPAAAPNPWGDAATHPGAARPGDVPPGYGQAPGYGQQPPYGQQPGYGQPQGAPGAYGWGPAPYQPAPAQPGIVPLRPLSIWEIFDGAFRAIRHNPKTMFGLTAAVVAVATAIGALIQWYVAGLMADEINTFLTGTGGLTPADTEILGDSFGTSLATFASLPITSLAASILTGLLILSVSRSVIGQRVGVGDVLRGSGKRVVWVVLFALLQFVVILVGSAVVVGLVVLAWNATESPGLTVLLGLLAAAVIVVGGFWFSIRTLLVPAALMLEGGRFWPTVARGWRLTRGSFWRLLGLYLLVNVLVNIVASVFTVPAAMISQFVFNDPFAVTGPSIVASAVATAVALTISTVFLAGVISLAYIDVRMRREGLDVELARAAADAGR